MLESPTLLIVDDEPSVLASLEETFTREKYTVLTAVDETSMMPTPTSRPPSR